ncbi:hypothetical protein [Hymenobacter negativus]|uniref:Gliding motility-associated protein GldM first immunoglobulin-like domain-containing protein n=1 Tax=Hymenobacter negativus TaxID=2795026 RepID=A0ABS3QIS2_9BACT|nr:hypothetical protein [Hymenobacter negativus]MBO2011143.1 hypothetical protein [Hymenobacter negativus]
MGYFLTNMKINNRFLTVCFVAILSGAGVFLHRGQAQNAVILEKIVALEARLAANNQQGAREMANTVYGISVAVSKNQNQVRDVVVLKESQQILSRAKYIVDTLHLFQQALRAAAHETSAGALHRPDVATQPGQITEEQLTRQLDQYTAFIRIFIPEVPALTQAGPEETTWFYAEHAPIASALASLTRLEAQVRHQTAEALNRQAQKVGSGCCMCFDKIGAIAVAASNTVAPGGNYKAQLFLTQAASSLRPIMSAEGKAIAVQPNGWGLVEIQVPPLQPNQPDTVRAHWRGLIQVRTSTSDTTFQVNVPYSIVKQPAR